MLLGFLSYSAGGLWGKLKKKGELEACQFSLGPSELEILLSLVKGKGKGLAGSLTSFPWQTFLDSGGHFPAP